MKISLQDDIDALSSVKNRIPAVFSETAQTNRAKIITHNGKPIGIMADIALYTDMIRKINMFKMVVEGEQSATSAPSISLSEVKKRLTAKYGISS